MESSQERWRKLLEDPEVIDVLFFGSSVRGKAHPGDVDVCVLWNREKKHIEGGISKNYEELFMPEFLAREDILADAISLRLGKKLSEAFGYSSFAGFIYSLRSRDYNERAKFHAAFRKVSEELGMLRFRGFALVPVSSSEKFKEFLKYWKVPFREVRLLFPKQEYEFLKGKKLEDTLI